MWFRLLQNKYSCWKHRNEERIIYISGLNYPNENIPPSVLKFGAIVTRKIGVDFETGDFVYVTTKTEDMPPYYWAGIGKTLEEADEQWNVILEELWDDNE